MVSNNTPVRCLSNLGLTPGEHQTLILPVECCRLNHESLNQVTFFLSSTILPKPSNHSVGPNDHETKVT